MPNPSTGLPVNDATPKVSAEGPGARPAPGRPARRHRGSIFDLRLFISGLFTIYGLGLTVYGLIATTQASLEKTAGIRINVWIGLVLLGTAAFFGVWTWLRPMLPARPTETGTFPLASAGGQGTVPPAAGTAAAKIGHDD